MNIPENYQKYLEYLPLFLISIAVGVLFTPIIGYIARKLKVIDYPPSMRDGKKMSDLRRLEKQPTPNLGGLSVLLPFLLLTLTNLRPSPEVIFFLTGTSVLVISGILDDKFEFSSKTQIFIHILATLIIVISPINLTSISNPLGGTITLDTYVLKETLLGIPFNIVFPGDLLVFAWILVCINAVKWFGGTDALMEGNTLISLIVFFILGIRFHIEESAIISIILAGLIFGYLFFNFHPQKIRTASTGKSSFGYILAVLSIMSGAKFATAITVLMLPLIDFIWVLIDRFITHKPKNPLSIMAISDQTHLHHKLLRLGLSEPKIALLEYLISATLGAVALASAGALRAVALIIVFIVTIGLLIVISSLSTKKSTDKPKKSDDNQTPESKYSY